jgi:hypothetical protein
MIQVVPDGTGIYAIENLMLPRAYVGATKSSFRQRWKCHIYTMQRRAHGNPNLLRDVRRYGTCAFRCVVLQELPTGIDYAPFEQFWLHYLSQLGIQCYNQMTPYEKPLYTGSEEDVPRGYSWTVLDLQLRLRISEAAVVRYLKTLSSGVMRTRWKWHFSLAAAEEVMRLVEAHRLERRRTHGPKTVNPERRHV